MKVSTRELVQIEKTNLWLYRKVVFEGDVESRGPIDGLADRNESEAQVAAEQVDDRA